ncbi:MAG: sulfotransferase [Flavobacteriia bacterium]|nr:sulfotransferase [Flavobacteriia bacterium]
MQVEKKYPSFIIGGAPKCGTSSLYFWLAAHPEACGSKVKEPYYFDNRITRFNENANYLNDGLDSYNQYFSHCSAESQAFEASAGYLYAIDTAIEGFQKLPQTPKVIFILRHPSKQLVSHYKMTKYRLNRKVDNLMEYATRERVDLFWHYSKSLSVWLEKYPKDKLKVVLFEDLISNKVNGMKAIAEFLDLDPTFYTDFDFEHRNESVAIKRKGLHDFGLKVQKYIPHFIQKRLLPLYLKTNSSNVPSISQEEEQFLKEMAPKFDQERSALEKLLPDLSFASWDKFRNS